MSSGGLDASAKLRRVDEAWTPVPYRDRCALRRVELTAALDRIIRACGAVADVERVVVFGSYARGRVSPWSDLDVLVVRDREAGDLVDDLYRSGEFECDLVAMRASQWPQALARTPFGRSIATEGIEVYARPAR